MDTDLILNRKNDAKDDSNQAKNKHYSTGIFQYSILLKRRYRYEQFE